jgi:hypothetical protein
VLGDGVEFVVSLRQKLRTDISAFDDDAVVRRWRRRYVAAGVDGLLRDATRPSRVKPLRRPDCSELAPASMASTALLPVSPSRERNCVWIGAQI